MAWGDSFVSAWNTANRGARAAAAALATGAKTVADGAAAAVQHMAHEAARAVNAVAETAVEAAGWVVDESKKIGKAISTTAKKLAAQAVDLAYSAAKKIFTGVAVGVATVTCEVKKALLGDQWVFDGAVLGAGCQQGSPAGVMPLGCSQSFGTLPKIVYVNGIRTRYTPEDPRDDIFSGGICKTMQEIATATCSEVTGVYNATEGAIPDVVESARNIAKAANSPAATQLRDMMLEAARSGRPMTLFAHSQGGLITQQAVAQAKQALISEDNLTRAEAEQRLGVISISSFGTAQEHGWPAGPRYERFTNTADPVPGIILLGQKTLRATGGDSAPAAQGHVFTDDRSGFLGLDRFASHDMDSVYLPKYKELKGAPNCLCRGG